MLASAAYAAPVIITDFKDQMIKRFDNKLLSPEEVQNRIRKAAGEMDWRVEPGEQSGRIIATLVVRGKHTAVVDIAFSADRYSITYKDSINLDYSKLCMNTFGERWYPQDEGSCIHPNYNKWVFDLNEAIYRRLQE
jgi:hypothetical protein